MEGVEQAAQLEQLCAARAPKPVRHSAHAMQQKDGDVTVPRALDGHPYVPRQQVLSQRWARHAQHGAATVGMQLEACHSSQGDPARQVRVRAYHVSITICNFIRGENILLNPILDYFCRRLHRGVHHGSCRRHRALEKLHEELLKVAVPCDIRHPPQMWARRQLQLGFVEQTRRSTQPDDMRIEMQQLREVGSKFFGDGRHLLAVYRQIYAPLWVGFRRC
mmetsp:Transcript_87991/g.142406  ORF Transcript_87991/g.142406 Transcript_87991/m.142406 type:complete len:220 (-) Transcript_87991:219-878(-)